MSERPKKNKIKKKYSKDFSDDFYWIFIYYASMNENTGYYIFFGILDVFWGKCCPGLEQMPELTRCMYLRFSGSPRLKFRT